MIKYRRDVDKTNQRFVKQNRVFVKQMIKYRLFVKQIRVFVKKYSFYQQI